MTIDQLIDETFFGHITNQECIRGVRQRLQALAAPSGLTRSEFESIYRDFAGYVRRVLYARGCPADMLEDMQSEVWTRVWEERQDYDARRSSIATFLSFRAKTVMGDYWRTLDKTPQTIPLPDGYSDDTQDQSSISTPSDAPLINLRNDLASVLTPFDLELLPMLEEGLQPTEIAMRLGLKPKTVANRLYALRQRVRKYSS
jgi:RNA polymerase sigma factor (sigma-70 family)